MGASCRAYVPGVDVLNKRQLPGSELRSATTKWLFLGFVDACRGLAKASWASIALMLPPDTSIECAPSHGKLAQWQPPPRWPQASLCRLYNQWANEAAGAVSKGLHPEFARAVARICEARH